jgi:NDP-sugar pyrophosphorylase family protein
MKAMILAAGKGTRVRPLTYDLPKPMIPILGKPVMEYLVEHLVRYGVQDIMVNVSYLHEKIEQYLATASAWVRISVIPLRGMSMMPVRSIRTGRFGRWHAQDPGFWWFL